MQHLYLNYSDNLKSYIMNEQQTTDLSQYPQQQLELLQAIYDMRQAQKDFFSQQNEHRKRIAIMREVKLDSLLQPYIKHGLIKTRVVTNIRTPKLF